MSKAIRNYARTWSFTPTHVHRPRTADEIVALVRAAGTLRVMGARHSWSQGIVTDDTLLSLDDMNQVLEVDRETMEVTVQAGIRLKDLITELEKRGLALENMGSIAEQSVAGAISTATHGTGLGHRCLADMVQSITLVDGRGEIREIGRSHPDFNAVIVGLGAFGVVFQVTLRVVGAFQMHAVTEPMPLSQAIETFDSIISAHDHVKFWWFPPNNDVIIFRQDHTEKKRNDSDFQRWFKDRFLAVLTYRPILWLQKFWRDPLVRWTNTLLAGAYAKRFERISKGHVAFLTPEPPIHRETEWAFDLAQGADLLRDYAQHMLDGPHSFNFVQELRVTKADPFWMSPSYGRDSMWLSTYNIDSAPRWEAQLQRFQEFAIKRGARPHWGKEGHLSPATIRQRYPRFDEWCALVRVYDPDGRFANPWLKDLLAAGAAPL